MKAESALLFARPPWQDKHQGQRRPRPMPIVEKIPGAQSYLESGDDER